MCKKIFYDENKERRYTMNERHVYSFYLKYAIRICKQSGIMMFFNNLLLLFIYSLIHHTYSRDNVCARPHKKVANIYYLSYAVLLYTYVYICCIYLYNKSMSVPSILIFINIYSSLFSYVPQIRIYGSGGIWWSEKHFPPRYMIDISGVHKT